MKMKRTQRMEMQAEVMENYKVSTREGIFASTSIGLVTPFLGLYAVALASPNIVIGLITALPALITFLVMIPGAGFIDRYQAKLPLVFWSSVLARLFYIPMAFVPFLPGFRGETFVLLLALMTIPGVILNLSWTSLVGNIFPVQHRGTLFGRRNMWCGLFSMLATVLAGFLLDIIVYPYNWTVIFLLASIIAMISSFITRRHKEERPVTTTTRVTYLKQLRAMLTDEKGGKKFRIFLAASALFHLGLSLAAPLFSIYLGRELELSMSLVGWLTTVMGFTTVLFSMYWGKKTSLYGDEIIFVIALFGMGVWPALFVLSPHPVYMLLLHAVLGIFIAAFNITIFNLLLNSASSQYKSASIATFHSLNSMTGFAGPFLGTWALAYVSVQQALVLSSILRLLGFLVFAWGCRAALVDLVRDLRHRHKRENPGTL